MKITKYFEIKDGVLPKETISSLSESLGSDKLVGVFSVDGEPVEKNKLNESVFFNNGDVDFVVKTKEEMLKTSNLSESFVSFTNDSIFNNNVRTSLDFNNLSNKISIGRKKPLEICITYISERLRYISKANSEKYNKIADLIREKIIDESSKFSISKNMEGEFITGDYKKLLLEVFTKIRNQTSQTVEILEELK